MSGHRKGRQEAQVRLPDLDQSAAPELVPRDLRAERQVHFAAVTMISTSIPGYHRRGDSRQARTGAFLGSTQAFHASLWAVKRLMSVSQTCAASRLAFDVPALASSASIRIRTSVVCCLTSPRRAGWAVTPLT